MTQPAPTAGPAPTSPPPPEPVVGVMPPKKTERPHPLTPLIRGWVILVAIIIGGGRSFLTDNNGRSGLPSLSWILLGVAAICVLAAAAGLITWWFTRFVIDDEELRIETGAIFRSSKRITFERIQTVDLLQPLAARIFGLAELRIDVGAGENQTKLRYLTRKDATRLRDYLMARAHGEQADAARASTADILTDSAVTDRVIAQVTPQRLVGAFFLSTELWMSVLPLAIAYIVTAVFHVVLYALPALIPALIGLFSLLSRSVLSQFNFTLAESGKGLRITRGLTTLTSQSIPLDRVQGLRVSQPILWRLLNWYRIDVDVLGIKTTHNNQDTSAATSVLQPVANPDQVRAVMALILPGVDLDAITMHPSPRRAAVLRIFDFWTLRYGWNDDVVVSQRGFLINAREVVPHEKTQSVRITRGPIQRRLGLASVEVDTTPGPVDLVAKHLEPAVARELALSQLARARRARDRAVERRQRIAAVTAERSPGPAEPAILRQFAITTADLLGTGGEARVFGLPDGQHVLRIYYPDEQHTTPESLRTSAPSIAPARPAGPEQVPAAPEQVPGGSRQVTAVPEQERLLADLLAGFDRQPAGLSLPLIIDRGARDGQAWRVDRRIPGTDLSAVLRSLSSTTERRTLLLSYLDVAMSLWRLPIPTQSWTRLISEPRPFPTLHELLYDQLERGRPNWDLLAAQVPDLDRRLTELKGELAQRRCIPALVHGDYFPPNVYVTNGPDGQPRVTGVGDFSPHTLVADPLMDMAGAVAFLELDAYPDATGDTRWLEGKLAERLGDDARWIDVYRRFYAFYYAMDPTIIDWCATQLRR